MLLVLVGAPTVVPVSYNLVQGIVLWPHVGVETHTPKSGAIEEPPKLRYQLKLTSERNSSNSFGNFNLGAHLLALFHDAHHVIESFCLDDSVVQAFFERNLRREFCVVNHHTEPLRELHNQ